MRDFSRYDTRHYPTLPVAEGYAAWAERYEATVLDLMDLRLLERLRSVRWSEAAEALDLACGTGRVGAWLRAKGVAVVDGVDLTPAMLEKAAARGVYRRLQTGDVTAPDASGARFDLITQSLADEHMADLRPLYARAAQAARPGAVFVLAGYHPWFLMAGIPTHFDLQPGRPVAIESYVHLISDHVSAGLDAGWTLQEMVEGLVDEAWVAAKPKWAVHRDRPVSFALAWRRDG